MTEPMSDERLTKCEELGKIIESKIDVIELTWACQEIRRLRANLTVLQNVEVKLMEAEAEVERLNNFIERWKEEETIWKESEAELLAKLKANEEAMREALKGEGRFSRDPWPHG